MTTDPDDQNSDDRGDENDAVDTDPATRGHSDANTQTQRNADDESPS